MYDLMKRCFLWWRWVTCEGHFTFWDLGRANIWTKFCIYDWYTTRSCTVLTFTLQRGDNESDRGRQPVQHPAGWYSDDWECTRHWRRRVRVCGEEPAWRGQGWSRATALSRRQPTRYVNYFALFPKSLVVNHATVEDEKSYKLEPDKFFMGKPSQNTTGVTQFYLRPVARHTRAQSTLTWASKAGTRFTYPGGMEGWVDIGAFIMPRPGIEPTTAWLKVRRPNRNLVQAFVKNKELSMQE